MLLEDTYNIATQICASGGLGNFEVGADVMAAAAPIATAPLAGGKRHREASSAAAPSNHASASISLEITALTTRAEAGDDWTKIN